MVSIIVPVYNIEKYLTHCVESLVAQTHSDIQIVLVNDGSTDGSGALCDALAKTDHRIRVVHKPNGGLSDARNAGLDVVDGQWILFVDGDDYLAPRAVESLLAAAEPEADFVQFHYQETEDLSWLPAPEQTANPVIVTNQADMWRWLYEKGGVAASSCTKLWAGRLFQNLRFQKGIRHEDEELINRILPLCHKAVYTDLVLYGYVMRPGSIIHSGFNPKSMDIFPIMEARVQVLEQAGLTELVRVTRERMFVTATMLYCGARRAGNKEMAGALKERMKALSGRDLLLSGQYRALYQCLRVTALSANAYYSIRRICGKS